MYSPDQPYPAGDIPEPLRKGDAELVFVTDRAWDEKAETFGADRSRVMTAGEVTVKIGEALDWSDLIEIAESRNHRKNRPVLTLGTIERNVIFPPTPIPYRLENGVVTQQADIAREYNEDMRAFRDMVRLKLNEAETDTVLLYIHGFNNGFDDAAFALADVWHYAGRGSVPVMFSWPTIDDNILGYFSARESGEFSIFHLKETLRALQQIEEVKAIDILAHSRGVDVSMTAIRELIIEMRGSGTSPERALKIQNLILAASDIDVAVAGQRLVAEHVAPAIGQITIYSNPDDVALGLSSLISSGLRVGRSTRQTYDEDFGDEFSTVDNVAFVNVSAVSGDLGHNYFRLNPTVIADISIILQSGAGPEDPARQLTPIEGNFYALEDR